MLHQSNLHFGRRMMRGLSYRVLCAPYILVTLISGCSSVATQNIAPQVPNYTPVLPADQYFSQQTLTSDWWHNFGKEKLQRLISDALVHSPSLHAQQAKVKQAEYQQQAFDSSTYLPQVNLQMSPQRMRNNAAPLGMSGGDNTYNLYQTRVVVSYNLDLSGGNSQALAGLVAQVDYQRYQLAGVRQMLIGQLLRSAIQQASLNEQIKLTQQLQQAQQQQLHMVEQQQTIGTSNLPEVLRLKQQLIHSETRLATLRQYHQHTSHQLALLSGKSPSDNTIPSFELKDFLLPSQLPNIISSELLKQRPDIRAAAALLQAATAQHGVSISKLYPQLNLSAGLGSQALTTSALFGSGAMIWHLAGQLLQPLFNPGIKQEIKASEAGQYAAAAHYQQTVLQAFTQVADVLRDIEASTRMAQLSQENLTFSQQQLNLVTQQQTIGSANELQHLQQQQVVLQSQLDVVTQQATRLHHAVALNQAIGGIWDGPESARTVRP